MGYGGHLVRCAVLAAIIVLPVLSTASASASPASEHNRFFDRWGTAKQCARQPIIPGGSVLAEPFNISRQWLQQGRIWCQLKWGPVETRGDGYFSGASAQCGEDAARGYFIGMALVDDKLTMRWDFPVSNGPLERCKDR